MRKNNTFCSFAGKSKQHQTRPKTVGGSSEEDFFFFNYYYYLYGYEVWIQSSRFANKAACLTTCSYSLPSD